MFLLLSVISIILIHVSPEFSSLPTLWHADILQVRLFRRIFFLADLWSVARHSQNIGGYWWEKAAVPFACAIVTQVVIFGVNCGLNPVDMKTRTQPLGRVTSLSSSPTFCPQSAVRGQVRKPWLEPPALDWIPCLLQFVPRAVSLLLPHRGVNRCTLRPGWNYWVHFQWRKTLIQMWREVNIAGRLAN